jgi:hypothetical protein
MAKRKETVQICDQCGKETAYESDGGYCGGHPLQGWLHLSEHGGSKRLEELQRKKEHDFCGVNCLLGYFNAERKV